MGVKLVPALVALAVGLAIRFVIPIPTGVSAQAWSLLAIFAATIVGLLSDPLPIGAWATVCVTVALATQTLSFAQAFSAMTNEVIWLIVASFFFAKGFEKTGLGTRIANLAVSVMGHSTLGLALGLGVAEAVVAPAMPSTSARAGGIFMPVIKSLSASLGSQPGDDSRLRAGAFLVQSQFQTSMHSSNLFATGAAQNLLCIKLAAEAGATVPSPFITWLQGAVVPALIGIVLTPVLVYALAPPQLRETGNAPAEARQRLAALGPMGRDESIMAGTMVLAVTLWVFGDKIGVAPVVAALVGLSVLLVSGVLTWKECLDYNPAWDTLIWFAVLISMSSALGTLGLIGSFSDFAGGALTSLGLPTMALFAALHVLFWGVHYLFASQTAHIGALYAAFLTLMLAAGVPPLLAAMSLAYNQNLFGSMTHYASGQAAVYCGAGYTRSGEVFKVGAALGLMSMALYGTVGMAWWRVLGWW